MQQEKPVNEARQLSTLDRKQRLQIPPQTLPKQDPQERIGNWEEVNLPLDFETAQLEAARCIQCPAAPCMDACPIHNDIPAGLGLLVDGDIIGAAKKFRESSHMPEVCGRVCPQESLCEGSCVVGRKNIPVAIGRLEAFCANYQREHGGWPVPHTEPPTGLRVAIVGSGPAGLAVAEEVTKQGHQATVYEVWSRLGGVLRYGIPTFKLNKGLIDEQVAMLKKIGVQFSPSTVVGKDITIDQLFTAGFDAVFLGYGAGQGMTMGVPGENLEGIYPATEFLVRANLPSDELPPHWREPISPGARVVVVGGGDTAMDCVRTAMRMDAREVVCVYRRTEAEMPGRREERRYAREEGVRFMYLTAPVRFVGDESGRVNAVRCQRMELGEPDASGRPRPVPILGSEFEIQVDTVVLAIGYRPERTLPETTPDLEIDKKALLVVDPETGRTTRPAVFAGGDNVHGADLVVTALADAKRAAAAINEYLRRKQLGET